MKNENHLNKRALARKIAARTGQTIDAAEECLDALVAIFRDTMQADGEIILQYMGVFSTAERGERLGYNPQTGETIVLKAKRKVKFTPSVTLNLDTLDEAAEGQQSGRSI